MKLETHYYTYYINRKEYPIFTWKYDLLHFLKRLEMAIYHIFAAGENEKYVLFNVHISSLRNFLKINERMSLHFSLL